MIPKKEECCPLFHEPIHLSSFSCLCPLVPLSCLWSLVSGFWSGFLSGWPQVCAQDALGTWSLAVSRSRLSSSTKPATSVRSRCLAWFDMLTSS